MTDEPWTKAERQDLARITLALVETCVRDTLLEDLHTGRTPISPAGDFSDVKIVSPAGEIPYLQASRISDEEMKALMIQVANRVFTFLSFPDHPIRLGGAARWDAPQLDEAMMGAIRRQRAIRDGADPATVYAPMPSPLDDETCSRRTPR
jgi:hypothetical protein